MPVEIDEDYVRCTILWRLRGIKSDSLRDDLYQAAWLAVLEAAVAYDAHPEWGSWKQTVHRVCRWAILNGRRRRRERPLCEALARDARRTPSVDARLDALTLLATLDVLDRFVIELRFWHGLTLTEIGQRIGVTRQAVEQRIERILASLRRSALH